MKRANIIVAVFLVFILSACSTTGNFKIPDNSQLYIYNRPDPVKIEANGKATTSPFFWTAAGVPPDGGIPYTLKKGNETVKEGKLRANIRVISFIWPPFAIIYWPVGFNPNVTYDLVNDTQQ